MIGPYCYDLPSVLAIGWMIIYADVGHREPSHRGVCAQNLRTRGLKNDDDVTLVLIFCAGHVGIYQINWL